MTQNNSEPEPGRVIRVPLKAAELPLALARARLSPEFDEELEEMRTVSQMPPSEREAEAAKNKVSKKIDALEASVTVD